MSRTCSSRLPPSSSASTSGRSERQRAAYGFPTPRKECRHVRTPSEHRSLVVDPVPPRVRGSDAGRRCLAERRQALALSRRHDGPDRCPGGAGVPAGRCDTVLGLDRRTRPDRLDLGDGPAGARAHGRLRACAPDGESSSGRRRALLRLGDDLRRGSAPDRVGIRLRVLRGLQRRLDVVDRRRRAPDLGKRLVGMVAAQRELLDRECCGWAAVLARCLALAPEH